MSRFSINSLEVFDKKYKLNLSTQLKGKCSLYICFDEAVTSGIREVHMAKEFLHQRMRHTTDGTCERMNF